jgi:ABC-type cobalamin/Fe3+-siderophores transport system ATPase subunit
VPAVLELGSLEAGYSNRMVISGLSLRLGPGEICGIIGPNGVGKSTLLRALLDLGPQTSGSVRICGRDSADLSRMERARMVAYVPQDSTPSPALTVMESVLLGRHPHRRGWASDSPRDREVARTAMESTETWGLRERLFGNISGGERRRVLIASALAQEPRLLLLDEPGASLDFRHRVNLWLLLGRLAGEGLAVLVTTHETNVASAFLDSVLLLRDGGHVRGAPADIFRADLLSEVFGVRLDVRRAGPGWQVVPDLPEERP